MVNLTKELKDNVLLVRLSGSIEESTDFEKLIGTTPQEVHVYVKEVSRINSVGVKAWIKYFQSLELKKVKLKFFECSTAIVEQINLISNFIVSGTVESIMVPFSCTNCKSELVGLFKTEQLKKIEFNLPDLKCSKCGDKAVFDDIQEEYFGFLMG